MIPFHSDITSPVSEQSSPLANIPHPPGSYSVCSDDGQTADDEATIDRSKKLRIPSIRRSRKNSPMTVRRVQDVGKRSRNRKRKGKIVCIVKLFIFCSID